LQAYSPIMFPSGQGTDLAGIVTTIGPGVTGSAADKVIGFSDEVIGLSGEVIGFTGRRASHAEYVVVEAQKIHSPAWAAVAVCGSDHVVSPSCSPDGVNS
jgi:NADPH:quinone reductase-like Zn-dependent oxidoreductase